MGDPPIRKDGYLPVRKGGCTPTRTWWGTPPHPLDVGGKNHCEAQLEDKLKFNKKVLLHDHKRRVLTGEGTGYPLSCTGVPLSCPGGYPLSCPEWDKPRTWNKILGRTGDRTRGYPPCVGPGTELWTRPVTGLEVPPLLRRDLGPEGNKSFCRKKDIFSNHPSVPLTTSTYIINRVHKFIQRALSLNSVSSTCPLFEDML